MAAVLSPKQLITCKHCSKPFFQRHRERRTFCSRECGFAFRKVNALSAEQKQARYLLMLSAKMRVAKVIKRCEVCSTEFLSKNSASRLCSNECRLEEGRRRSPRYVRDRHSRPCTGCGESFTPTYGDKRRSWCSPRCSKKVYGAKRKAILRGRGRNIIEIVNPFVVFRRDKYVCQLCGRLTLHKKRGTYDDRAPELDHIIPLSRGGDHTYANTQCSCRKCNIAKGATPLGQLRLAI